MLLTVGAFDASVGAVDDCFFFFFFLLFNTRVMCVCVFFLAESGDKAERAARKSRVSINQNL